MLGTMRHSRTALLTATLAAGLFSIPQISLAAGRGVGIAAFAQSGDSAASEAMSKLNKKQFKDVKVTVDNGIATLSGTVDLYEDKVDADKRIHKVKGISAVRNEIEVAGPSVSDQELQSKLGEKLAYDRVGYGNAFNAITLSVQNGAVTLGGHARTYVDRDSALALVSTYPGVNSSSLSS
jgi:hyperosmotically inducible protein